MSARWFNFRRVAIGLLVVLCAESLWHISAEAAQPVERFLANYRMTRNSPEELSVWERITYSFLVTRWEAKDLRKEKAADPKARRFANH